MWTSLIFLIRYLLETPKIIKKKIKIGRGLHVIWQPALVQPRHVDNINILDDQFHKFWFVTTIPAWCKRYYPEHGCEFLQSIRWVRGLVWSDTWGAPRHTAGSPTGQTDCPVQLSGPKTTRGLNLKSCIFSPDCNIQQSFWDKRKIW